MTSSGRRSMALGSRPLSRPRDRGRLGWGAWLLAVGLAACQATAPPSPATSATTSAAASGSPTEGESPTHAVPQPSVEIPPLPAGELVLTCGDGLMFAAEALAGPGGAEAAADPVAAALRAFLPTASTPEQPFPAIGWHRVVTNPTEVVFLAPNRGGQGWLQVAFQLQAGAWVPDRWGDCRAAAVTPEGLGPASWWLDPGRPRPAAGDREFVALVREETCASGRPPDGRIAPPLVVYGEQAISLRFGVTPLAGGQDCQSNPSGEYRVTLTEPIGDRVLLDGGVFPPRDATTQP